MKRRHPLIPLVLWLGLSVLALLFALVLVIGRMHATQAQLDAAHLQGMQQGNQMCLEFRSVPEGPRPAAAPQGGGLL